MHEALLGGKVPPYVGSKNMTSEFLSLVIGTFDEKYNSS